MTTKTMTMGPGTLTIGETTDLANLETQCKSVTLSPSASYEDNETVLDGSTLEGERTEEITLSGTLKQDFGAENSTTEWLWEHRGQVLPFEFIPNTSTGRGISGNLRVEGVDIGGDVKTRPDADFEFQVIGEPTFFDAS